MTFKIIIAGAVGCLMAGCGSTASTPPASVTAPAAAASPSPTSEPGHPSAAGSDPALAELKAAVQAYSDAFLTGDGKTAYGLLSQRCRKRTTQTQFSGIVDAAKDLYGSALPLKTFTATISGDLARVTYTYSIKAINQDREPWVREDGAWHEDDC
jgi:hypothetical protein